VITAADIDACDVRGQYSRFRCLVHGLRAIDERNPDLLRPDLKARINFTSRHNGTALRPREPLTPFVARVLKDAADRSVVATRERILSGREQIEALRNKPERSRFENVFLRVADGTRPARSEFDMFKYRKVAIAAASDLLVLTLPDAICFIIAIALRVEMPIECLRTLRRDCLKNPARGYVSIEYTKGRGGPARRSSANACVMVELIRPADSFALPSNYPDPPPSEWPIEGTRMRITCGWASLQPDCRAGGGSAFLPTTSMPRSGALGSSTKRASR
jgi:hypothetical protein